MDQIKVAMLALSLAYVYSLPLNNHYFHPVKINAPKAGNGYCLTLAGEKIKVGEWQPAGNCSLNCTCIKIEKNEYLECVPWCKLQRKVCNLGETVSELKYFETVGDSGCKRCIAVECDAIRFPTNVSNISNIHSTVKVSKQHRTDGKYEIVGEIEEIIVNPNSRLFN